MRTSGKILVAVLATLVAVSATMSAEVKIEEQVVGPVGQDVKYVVSPLTADGQHRFGIARQGAIVGSVADGKLKLKSDEVSPSSDTSLATMVAAAK